MIAFIVTLKSKESGFYRVTMTVVLQTLVLCGRRLSYLVQLGESRTSGQHTSKERD